MLRRARRVTPEVLRAVDGVDLEIARGEALGLVGESGCGKSTLGRCIVGLYAPTGGEIRYAGEQLPVKRARAQRRRMQMVFQDPYSSLNPRMTVRQVLSELLRVHDMVPKNRVDERCRELIELVGLRSRALDAHPRNFSGGQRQRVSIARALALEPELLVADEPVSALDVSVQATVLNLLDELRAKLGPDDALHRPQHGGRAARVRPGGGDVSGPDRRDGRRPRSSSANPRHPYTQGAPEGRAAARARAAPARRRRWRATRRARSTCRPDAGSTPAARSPRRCATREDPACVARGGAHLAACHFAWTAPPPAHVPEVITEAEAADAEAAEPA